MPHFTRVGWVLGVAVVVLVSHHRGRAQVTLDPAWPENPRTYGGEDRDLAYCVENTRDGGLIVAGRTSSYGAGMADVYLIKLDAHGDLDPAWGLNPRIFGGPGPDEARSIQETEDGGYVIAGSAFSFEVGGSEVYVVKLLSDGSLDPAWDPNPKTFGGYSTDGASDARQTSDGGYVLVGWTRSFGAGGNDVYLIKLDAQGNLDPAWDPDPKTFGGSADDDAQCVRQTSDGGFVVAGQTFSSGAGSTGSSDVYLLKLDANGNLDPAWHPNPKTLGGEADDVARAIQQTADGGYIVVGGSWSPVFRSEDLYVIKLDAQGNLDSTWDLNPRTLGGESSDGAYSVQQTLDGGYLLAGHTFSFGAGSGDVYLVKLDSAGALDPSWNPNPRTFGGKRDDAALSVLQASDGSYLVAGWTFSSGLGRSDVLLLKLGRADHFLRGDCNSDGVSEGISDAVSLLEYNFAGGALPSCLAACDSDGDGKVAGTVTDAVYLLNHFFRGGASLPEPYPACGAGQLWSDGRLGCEIEPGCP